MKVRMLLSIAGHADASSGLEEFSFAPGQVVDLSDRLAASWIEAGHAELLKRATRKAAPESDSEQLPMLETPAQERE